MCRRLMLCLLADILKRWLIRVSIILDVGLTTANFSEYELIEVDSTPRGPVRSYKTSDELRPPHHRSYESGCGRGYRAEGLRRCFISYAPLAIVFKDDSSD